MAELYRRQDVLDLLHEHTKSDSLRKHAYAVEAAMRGAALRTGNDPELWGAVGLLHDFDYERYPGAPDHPQKGAEILRARGYPESFVRAILSHASYSGVPREDDCARWLFAVDELCGFCMACAMVQPDRRLASVKVSSVLKKLRRKEFAAKVSREEIQEGAEGVGLPLEELVARVLCARPGPAGELGRGAGPWARARQEGFPACASLLCPWPRPLPSACSPRRGPAPCPTSRCRASPPR
jgi:putative nucleotidyltransferase with HDIG domain